MRSRLLVLLALVLPSFAFGQSQANEVADCITIPSESERLACYDRVLTGTLEQSNPSGDWRLQTDISPMTDEVTAYIRVDSNQPLLCSGYRRMRAALIFRCMEGKIAAYVSQDCYLAGDNDRLQVQYRRDSNEPLFENLDISTDNRAFGFWGRGAAAVRFINLLLDTDRLTIRYSAYNESPDTAIFNVTGLRQAIAPVYEACGVDLIGEPANP